ncbi:hypothetical protein H696_00192 [Fonticula alba]|uniref:Uncharacterized protein n=1 Tax=Fonticula alba TaxID=691883 RepID=A0A058ZF97_FONAL|nr:hypothetical protein H696_00192 [Fonticula alba]KCV72608.1 hypothetical protein H696_00192 [Fonticula alba]|eukprot:XP_009492309.1 hypothetical protein H696_00192 [Fonticula alba]
MSIVALILSALEEIDPRSPADGADILAHLRSGEALLVALAAGGSPASSQSLDIKAPPGLDSQAEDLALAWLSDLADRLVGDPARLPALLQAEVEAVVSQTPAPSLEHADWVGLFSVVARALLLLSSLSDRLLESSALQCGNSHGDLFEGPSLHGPSVAMLLCTGHFQLTIEGLSTVLPAPDAPDVPGPLLARVGNAVAMCQGLAALHLRRAVEQALAGLAAAPGRPSPAVIQLMAHSNRLLQKCLEAFGAWSAYVAQCTVLMADRAPDPALSRGSRMLDALLAGLLPGGAAPAFPAGLCLGLMGFVERAAGFFQKDPASAGLLWQTPGLLLAGLDAWRAGGRVPDAATDAAAEHLLGALLDRLWSTLLHYLQPATLLLERASKGLLGCDGSPTDSGPFRPAARQQANFLRALAMLRQLGAELLALARRARRPSGIAALVVDLLPPEAEVMGHFGRLARAAPICWVLPLAGALPCEALSSAAPAPAPAPDASVPPPSVPACSSDGFCLHAAAHAQLLWEERVLAELLVFGRWLPGFLRELLSPATECSRASASGGLALARHLNALLPIGPVSGLCLLQALDLTLGLALQSPGPKSALPLTATAPGPEGMEHVLLGRILGLARQMHQADERLFRRLLRSSSDGPEAGSLGQRLAEAMVVIGFRAGEIGGLAGVLAFCQTLWRAVLPAPRTLDSLPACVSRCAVSRLAAGIWVSCRRALVADPPGPVGTLLAGHLTQLAGLRAVQYRTTSVTMAGYWAFLRSQAALLSAGSRPPNGPPTPVAEALLAAAELAAPPVAPGSPSSALGVLGRLEHLLVGFAPKEGPGAWGPVAEAVRLALAEAPAGGPAQLGRLALGLACLRMVLATWPKGGAASAGPLAVGRDLVGPLAAALAADGPEPGLLLPALTDLLMGVAAGHLTLLGDSADPMHLHRLPAVLARLAVADSTRVPAVRALEALAAAAAAATGTTGQAPGSPWSAAHVAAAAAESRRQLDMAAAVPASTPGDASASPQAASPGDPGEQLLRGLIRQVLLVARDLPGPGRPGRLAPKRPHPDPAAEAPGSDFTFTPPDSGSPADELPRRKRLRIGEDKSPSLPGLLADILAVLGKYAPAEG